MCGKRGPIMAAINSPGGGGVRTNDYCRGWSGGPVKYDRSGQKCYPLCPVLMHCTDQSDYNCRKNIDA